MSPRVEFFVNKSGNVLHRPRTWIGPNLHRIAMSDTCDVIQLLGHVVWESHHRRVITSHLTLGRSAVIYRQEDRNGLPVGRNPFSAKRSQF
jgi:hypothetical protein